MVTGKKLIIMPPCGNQKVFGNHSHVVTEKNWLPHECGNLNFFDHHFHVVIERFLATTPVWRLETFRSSQCLSPPPTPQFFPFFIFPPDSNQNPFNCHLV
jgi:hypothetical protein